MRPYQEDRVVAQHPLPSPLCARCLLGPVCSQHAVVQEKGRPWDLLLWGVRRARRQVRADVALASTHCSRLVFSWAADFVTANLHKHIAKQKACWQPSCTRLNSRSLFLCRNMWATPSSWRLRKASTNATARVSISVCLPPFPHCSCSFSCVFVVSVMTQTVSDKDSSGATAVVVIVDRENLYVANAGDSRAVICRSSEKDRNGAPTGSAAVS